MEEKDKISIQKNFIQLINKTDLNELLPRLIQNGVYSQELAEPYRNINSSDLDRKRNLFSNIHRRGPNAFKKLVQSLQDSHDYDHKYLAGLLEGKTVPLNIELTSKHNNSTNAKKHHNIINEQNTIQEDIEDNNYNTASSTSRVHPFKLTEHQRPCHIRQISQESIFANINLNEEPIKVVVKKSEFFFDNQALSKVPMYSMRAKCRGAYLGINNMDFINGVKDYRKGAQVDEENLKELFKQMGFRISSYRNQTKFDMITTIKNFTDVKYNPDLKHADCLIITIMSHGEEGDTKDSSYVVTSDNKCLSVSWIIEQFNNDNCVVFQNKPKIFIFQICRGENLHLGVPTNRTQSDGVNSNAGRIRNMTDMLLAFATLPGDKSYRDICLGTWYIQLLCEVFMNHAYDTDVEHLLKMVDEELGKIRSDDGNMQTSTYESRAFKICYLHPGLYLCP